MAWLDRTGIFASAACAVHCVGISALLAVPSLSWLAASWFPWLESVDPWLMAASLACALTAMGYGFMKHGRMGPMTLGAAGVGFWALSILGGHDHGMEGGIFSLLAAILIICAHVWNIKCLKCCRTHECKASIRENAR